MITVENKGNHTLIPLDFSSYEVNYGTIKKGSNTYVKLLFTSEEDFESFQAKPSCGGCTTVTQKKITNNSYQVNITYDSKLLGRILKSVSVNYTLNNSKEVIKINLRGTIIL